jgi:hypothetical protein
MSEVPIKHLWTTPTVELDFTSLTNRITELRATVYTLTRERDAAVQDAAHQLELRFDANRELVALQQETDALRTVYDAAKVYWLYRTATNEDALIDAVGAVKRMGVRP